MDTAEPPAVPVIDAILRSIPASADVRLLDLRVGPYWTAVQTSAGTGMASTMAGEPQRQARVPIAAAGRLRSADPLDLTELLRSASAPEAAVGMAAVNALLGTPEGRTEDGNAKGILNERAEGRVVAIIGHFPFVDSLRKSCRELWVFERGRGRGPGDLGPEHVAEVLPHAEVVAISATTLINHTLQDILPFIRPNAFTMMLGPSTPMAPLLLELGFDVLCGTIVEDPQRVLRAVEQGAVTSQIGGVRRVCLWG
ncbi:MAG: Rossmann-like domain-containing protein [Thermoanaerobaculales bacterium]